MPFIRGLAQHHNRAPSGPRAEGGLPPSEVFACPVVRQRLPGSGRMMDRGRTCAPVTAGSACWSGVSLTCRRPASASGILGHNGMGKSTLMRAHHGIAASLVGTHRRSPADRSSASFRRIAVPAPASRWFPQGRMILPWPVRARQPPLRCRRERRSTTSIEPALAEFLELRRLLDRLGGALSGGRAAACWRSRAPCAAIRACCMLDEPTEGIQPSIVEGDRRTHRSSARRPRPVASSWWSRTSTSSAVWPSACWSSSAAGSCASWTARPSGDPALEHEFFDT